VPVLIVNIIQHHYSMLPDNAKYRIILPSPNKSHSASSAVNHSPSISHPANPRPLATCVSSHNRAGHRPRVDGRLQAAVLDKESTQKQRDTRVQLGMINATATNIQDKRESAGIAPNGVDHGLHGRAQGHAGPQRLGAVDARHFS
jgi:hypothetical protein